MPPMTIPGITFDQAMDALRKAQAEADKLPVPMCHFTPMTLHTSCSDMSGASDGYQCDFCGHTESCDEAWAKVEARAAKKATAVHQIR